MSPTDNAILQYYMIHPCPQETLHDKHYVPHLRYYNYVVLWSELLHTSGIELN